MSGNQQQTSIAYDPQRYWPTSVSSGPVQLSYQNYDGVGNVRRIADARGADYTFDFTYDELDRLQSSTRLGAVDVFDYDAHGNRQGANFYPVEQIPPAELRWPGNDLLLERQPDGRTADDLLWSGCPETTVRDYIYAGTRLIAVVKTTRTVDAGLCDDDEEEEDPPAGPGNQLNATDKLLPGEYRRSSNGRFTFVYQADGNLVLYDNNNGQPLWSSVTRGTGTLWAIMQSDSNLVVYNASGTTVCASNTGGNADPGVHLVVQDDGNVVIYSAAGAPSWATGTAQP